jgi:transposase-like protein
MTTTAKKIEQDSASATPNPSDWPEWAETAYRAHARGQRNISALSKQFGVGWQTCRDWIRRVGCFMAEQEEQAELEARAEYVAGLEEILGQAQATYAKTENDNAKIGALRVALDSLEKLAAARGVVTKREGKEHTGPGGGPVEMHHEFDHLSDQELAALLLATSDDGETEGAGED